jgi:S1-C subfamily serine protease
VYAAPSQGRYLGIDEQPVVDSGGRGMQVTRVFPGSAAEQAGLQVGDVIHSANGYLTQEHGNLAWIIANTPSNGELRMNVRTVRDGADHLIIARVP